MRFLVDNQLPAALARWLNSVGVDCEHVLEAGLAQATDSQIWRYAAEHGMVVIGKDEDFFHRASRPRPPSGSSGCGWGTTEDKNFWPRIVACLESGDRIVEVR